jgi:hypothetical protein
MAKDAIVPFIVVDQFTNAIDINTPAPQKATFNSVSGSYMGIS